VSQAAQPDLDPGRAYRTQELRRWSANPARLAKRLVCEGKLRQAAYGLFYAPIKSRFGEVPARDEELLRAFLADSPFVITGPPRWNALGLGSTAMFAATMAYNTRRTGEFVLDGRPFLLRRVLFTENPPPEWFVVDLLQHHEMAGVSLADLEERIAATLREGRWDAERLHKMADKYGSKATLALVERCIPMRCEPVSGLSAPQRSTGLPRDSVPADKLAATSVTGDDRLLRRVRSGYDLLARGEADDARQHVEAAGSRVRSVAGV